MIIDQENHTIIIADSENNRVIRWTQDQKQEIIIENVDCYGLTMDQFGFLYITDCMKNEVRK